MPTEAETLELLEALEYVKTFRRMETWVPYPKQRMFFRLGATKRERIFLAGNQVGKTEAGAFEAMCHATGLYPEWWDGKRFGHKTVGWVAGVSSNDVKRVAQRKLCGPPGVESEWGTGLIPKDCLLERAMTRGVTDAIDELQVQHCTDGKKDGVSRIVFKSYEQGRKTFQGDTIDWGWGDEESEKADVYPEFLTRLKGNGIMWTTFTPLFGPTDFVNRFMNGDEDKGVVQMELDEVPLPEDGGHFSAAERQARKAGYLSHEAEARTKGIPLLGSGAIFMTPEARVVEPHWTTFPITGPRAGASTSASGIRSEPHSASGTGTMTSFTYMQLTGPETRSQLFTRLPLKDWLRVYQYSGPKTAPIVTRTGVAPWQTDTGNTDSSCTPCTPTGQTNP